MSHSFLDDDHFLISGRTEDYRAFLNTNGPLVVHVRRIATKSAKAVGAFMHRWAVAIGESKLRRVQRELALQGIHYSYDELSKPARDK